MKGIILAGGNGTRLYPTTQIQNKGLLPVYDKPMIYYPLCTLIENGVNDICLITSPEHMNNYKNLFKNIHEIGINMTFLVQKNPNGIPEAFLIAKKFIKGEKVALILGDNIFYGSNVFRKAFQHFRSGATVFGYEVNDPERYGVINFEEDGTPMSLVEKPEDSKSNFAVPGLYLFDEDVIKYTKKISPSERGELEITSVINQYLAYNKLKVYKINRGCAWLDAGTPKALQESSEYIKVIEERQGIKIGCIEEASFVKKFVSKTQLKEITAKMPNSDYKEYLEKIL
ncbi:glucose-1-phosphate thymidylyltransferase [Candidatus Pacearchaeota archaeon]|nr:glucose-1-phosphate thymidylyltransferase [Candidatus Pacearchaeota archaeon]